MFNIAFNGIITVNRGDSFTLPMQLNYGTNLEPMTYTVEGKSIVYFAVMEPNQPFECALIRKKYTAEDVDENGNIVTTSDTSKTETQTTTTTTTSIPRPMLHARMADTPLIITLKGAFIILLNNANLPNIGSKDLTRF